MGSNMQAQAVPLVAPEIPLVSTGMESYAAIDSGQVLTAQFDGEILSVSADEIQIRYDNGTLRTHQLRKYQRSNQSTCIDQRPTVTKGERIKAGQVLADSSSTVEGQLALGAFLSHMFDNPRIQIKRYAYILLKAGRFYDNIVKHMKNYMELALKEAKKAEAEEEVPVGAVIVKGNEIIAKAHNKTRQTHDPTAHAEILAIRETSEKIGSTRLSGYTIYYSDRKSSCRERV